jgi:hypothetical protein
MITKIRKENIHEMPIAKENKLTADFSSFGIKIAYSYLPVARIVRIPVMLKNTDNIPSSDGEYNLVING